MSGPPPIGLAQPPVLDVSQLVEVCGGDRDFETLIAGEFRKATLTALEELAQAIASRDRARTKAWSHAIKGSSATLGGRVLAAHCQRLELLAAAEPDWADAARLLSEIRAAYDQLDQALAARSP